MSDTTLMAVIRIAGKDTQVTGRAARIARWVSTNHEKINRARVGQLQFDFSGNDLKVQTREMEVDVIPI